MTTLMLPPDTDDLQHAARLLGLGQLVAMPTETVYGLAAAFDQPEAVAKVFEAKGRPAHDPLIVHVAPSVVSPSPLEGLAGLGLIDPEGVHEAALSALSAALWPGPLTVVLPRGPAVSDAITAGLDTVAIRVPAHPVAQQLLEAAGVPLVAPSANRFGRISPTTAQAVHAELSGELAAIVDGGPCEVGVESTVILLHPDGSATLLRPGATDPDTLADRLPGALHRRATPSGDADDDGPPTAAPSPGLLERHYAPATPMLRIPFDGWIDPELAERLDALPPGPLGLIPWQADRAPAPLLGRRSRIVPLSDIGDPAQAARRLYAVLRELDESDATHLVIESPPEGGGLREAIADRMARASEGWA